MSALKILTAGPLTTIQDLGRFGYQYQGITTGGALDEHAARWANKLLGNAPGAALLEITLGNFSLEAETDTWIAITGARAELLLNGESVSGWQTLKLHAGDQLSIGWAEAGMRIYLAVYGGIQSAPEFGSRSTVVREGIGGLAGKAIVAGDQLPVAACPAASPVAIPEFKRSVPPCYLPDYFQAERFPPEHLLQEHLLQEHGQGDTSSLEGTEKADEILTLRVIEGYQIEHFSNDCLKNFYSESYQIRSESDRMGIRLQGSPLQPQIQGIASEGICFGAIQVPSDGQPIVLLKDRQTLGGYPKLGSLLPLDSFKLAQQRPGTLVRFTPISAQAAVEEMRAFYQFFSF